MDKPTGEHTMGRLHQLLADHVAAQSYAVSQRQVAARLGVAPSTIENWRTPRELVAKEHLVAIARLTGRPYADVLEALLHDIGYLHEAQQPVAKPRSRRGRDVRTAAAEALREASARATVGTEATAEAGDEPVAESATSWDSEGNTA